MAFPFAALSASFPRQLPTYNGTKSYQNLLVEVYGMQNVGNNRDTSIQANLLGFIRSGEYYFNSGKPYGYSDEGLYWQSGVSSNIDAWSLFFRPTGLDLKFGYYKGDGMPLRCLVR